MKIVFRTVVFHIVCILIFAFLYFTYADDFKWAHDNSYIEKNNSMKKKHNFLDFLLFSTTIQAGVGISEFFPSSSFTKIILVIQQLIMISTHVFTIYFFTL